jgi:GT2 family glycosyltransferase
MFIRGSCYADTGFNLSYFLGWEDIDLCYRVQAKGWRVTIASRAQAWHQGGATISRDSASYYYARNRIWFSRRWGTPAQACLVWLWVAVVTTPRIFLADCLIRRSLNHTRSTLHALVDGLVALPSGNAVLPDEPRPARWLRGRS